MKLFARFASDSRGATAIEYGILGGLLAVVIIGAFGLIGGNLETVMNTLSERIQPK